MMVNMNFIQLFWYPFANIMEHLIEMPTDGIFHLHFYWHLIAPSFAQGLIIM